MIQAVTLEPVMTSAGHQRPSVGSGPLPTRVSQSACSTTAHPRRILTLSVNESRLIRSDVRRTVNPPPSPSPAHVTGYRPRPLPGGLRPPPPHTYRSHRTVSTCGQGNTDREGGGGSRGTYPWCGLVWDNRATFVELFGFGHCGWKRSTNGQAPNSRSRRSKVYAIKLCL